MPSTAGCVGDDSPPTTSWNRAGSGRPSTMNCASRSTASKSTIIDPGRRSAPTSRPVARTRRFTSIRCVGVARATAASFARRAAPTKPLTASSKTGRSVELDEMLRVTDYRPGRGRHVWHALPTALPRFAAEYELLEVTAQNPTGAVSESQNREIAARSSARASCGSRRAKQPPAGCCKTQARRHPLALRQGGDARHERCSYVSDYNHTYH